MTAQLLEGKPVAEAVLEEVTKQVADLRSRGVTPGLGTILVGDDPASVGYVRKKHQTCEAVGIASFHRALPAGSSQAELSAAVREFNESSEVHAYLIQNPTPGVDFNAALAEMDPAKDADGLHPTSLGLLALGAPGPRPCTPAGIQAMLAHYEIPVAGKHVVVVGRGPTLGRPLSMLLALKEPHANAAVTVVHTGVSDWSRLTKIADIVVGAAGVPNMITPDVVKPGAVVIGGGMTWEGKRAFSDVDERCAEVASWVTPRLGGVGPTTVAMLLRNTVTAASATAAGVSAG